MLGHLSVPMSELSQFVNVEGVSSTKNGQILKNRNAGHAGWYVLQDSGADTPNSKGLTGMLRDVTVGTIQTTVNVTSQVTSSTVNTLMMPLRFGEESESPDSGDKDSPVQKGTTQKTTKRAQHSAMSTDAPRDDISTPQLHFRLRIIEG